MAADRILASRFEMKYMIGEAEAVRVREFVRSYMELDEFGVGRANFAYPVHSLYLDSDDLLLYWKTINGEKNRYKLRVRFYDDDPEAPAFFEIKRRQNNCIIKHRAAVKREWLPVVLDGQMPPQWAFTSWSLKHQAAMAEFLELIQSIGAKPRAHVAYVREAYLPADDSVVRVTMDRLVRTEPQFSSGTTTAMRKPTYVWPGVVVLELKFTDRFPLWFRDMVQALELTQCSAAKYAAGIELLGEHRFARRALPVGREPAAAVSAPLLTAAAFNPQPNTSYEFHNRLQTSCHR